jgi:aspartyl-tRNA(Asn)/glutamyl-tRNA(Gln) amidotransferase subunit A
VAFASSLDQISPFARNVSDAAAILQVISGFDPKDSTSLPQAKNLDLMGDLESGVKGLRIGVITELEGSGMQPDVSESMQNAIRVFESLGASIHRVSLPSSKYAVAAYYILATAEASSNLARFDGVRYGYRKDENQAPDITSMYCKTRAEGFGPEVKRRIMLGTFCLSSGYYEAYYGKAQKTRQRLRTEFNQAWKEVDVLICPTSPTTAFKIGEKANDPVSMYLSDIATIPVNLVGIPGISVPSGFDQQGLPIGLQILGPHLSENKILRVARAFERETGLLNLQPKWG